MTFEFPDGFTDPFRYVPHASVRLAAASVIRRIESSPDLHRAFSEGKMLGVMVCTRSGSDAVLSKAKDLLYIAAFSGTINGRSTIDGFVPPIYDLTAPDGEFRRREAEITGINLRIRSLEEDGTLNGLKKRLSDAQATMDMELASMKAAMAASKEERDRLRMSGVSEEVNAGLIRRSQYEKAELKRLKSFWVAKIDQIREDIGDIHGRITALKEQRAALSEELQKWIFRQYKVHNAEGGCSTIADIFEGQGLVAPGGTGECAAPKLLEYAWRNGLTPLAMGEFWYGKPSDTAVRTHGRFYPSCTSKCGPLLGYMLKGLRGVSASDSTGSRCRGGIEIPLIIYEDDAIIVVKKPGGMPSVPGLDGRESCQEWLTEHISKRDEDGRCEIHAVHRLDMDTSGVIVFARTSQAAVDLREQFEEHSVQKTYMARVDVALADDVVKMDSVVGADGIERVDGMVLGQTGSIDLPLAPDYDERPRQKVDFIQGKAAHTDYKVVAVNPDGTADLLLYPRTGRTHQLRVHCAHHLGLSCPIIGDRLYGGHSIETEPPHNSRETDCLHLHALSITFRHPLTGAAVTFTAPCPF
ncbi:MAG: hypothetical protein E7111_06765 [Bacteroidales bacterium]|nr:hypothetical protein [Bacteroidales bacterium]